MKEKIALGFGNNIDYEIVWNSEVIEDLVAFVDQATFDKLCNPQVPSITRT